MNLHKAKVNEQHRSSCKRDRAAAYSADVNIAIKMRNTTLNSASIFAICNKSRTQQVGSAVSLSMLQYRTQPATYHFDHDDKAVHGRENGQVVEQFGPACEHHHRETNRFRLSERFQMVDLDE